ncbi:hypothetical protein [Thermodesulfitimonas autotrophica]|uniref:hypothetical protein n=1 Tax=Thermodesulfitimonas autotrophica TaxID=1894989 RepID=UPI002FE109D2
MRISLAEDRRIFTPVARSSYKWETTYKKHTPVERVNARLDEAFGFEKHSSGDWPKCGCVVRWPW